MTRSTQKQEMWHNTIPIKIVAAANTDVKRGQDSPVAMGGLWRA